MSGTIPDIIKTKEYKPVDESSFLKMAHVLHSLRERYPNFILKIDSVSNIANSMTVFIRHRSGQNIDSI